MIEEGVRSVDNTEACVEAGIEADMEPSSFVEPDGRDAAVVPGDDDDFDVRDRWAHSLSKKCRAELDQG